MSDVEVRYSDFPPYVVVKFTDPAACYLLPLHSADAAEDYATDDELRGLLIEQAREALGSHEGPHER